MAEEKVIVIKADTSQAEKSVKGLTKDVDKLGEVNQQNNKKTQKNVKSLGDSAKKTTSLFKGLGTAIKATGIGLVVSLVASLTAAFSKNQKFMNAFNTVAETISIVLSKVSDALVNVYESVSSNTENFNALGKVLGGLVTLILTPLKLTFFGIKLGIQQAQLSWEKSFFGGKDKNTIKGLTLDILETKEAIFSTGKDAVNAGKDVVNNFGEAITETSNIAKKTQEELSKISIKNSKLQAKNIVNLRNSAELAEAKLSGLTLKYQKDAEIQRQIRDDVRLSIEDRIKANDKLGQILDNQAKDELKLAKQKLALAGAELSINSNRIENQVAYQNALNEVADVEERITGQRSEQLTNEAALLDERKANLQELRNIGKTDVELEKQEALTKYENQKTLIERTVNDEKEKNNLLLNAKKEYNDNLDAIDKEHQEKIDEILKVTEEKENETLVEKLEKEKERKLLELEELEANEQQKASIRAFYNNKIKEAEIKAKEDIVAEKERLDKIENETKIKLLNTSFRLAESLAKKGSAVAKGIAVARALQNTYQGITAELATKTVTPFEIGLKIANIATVSAIGFKSVKDILATNEKSSGGGGGASTPSAPPPSFNLVQGTDSNQIAESISAGNERPAQAFVVGSNVTTQQELDRNKIEIGSI